MNIDRKLGVAIGLALALETSQALAAPEQQAANQQLLTPPSAPTLEIRFNFHPSDARIYLGGLGLMVVISAVAGVTSAYPNLIRMPRLGQGSRNTGKIGGPRMRDGGYIVIRDSRRGGGYRSK